MEEIMYSIIYSLLIGVVSGLIASIIYFVILRLMKPKLIVAPSIVCKKLEGEYQYSIKVVNKTKAALTNVFYSLQVHSKDSSNIVNIDYINPTKQILCHIEKYSKNSDDEGYAVRFSFTDEHKQELSSDSYLVFTIYATHSISGRMVFSQVKYGKNEVKTKGVYETGLSTRIV